VLSALHRRNHLPLPPDPSHPFNTATGIKVWSASFRAPGCTSGPIVTFAPQHTLRALRVRTLCAERPPAGFRVISKAIDVAGH
jgi:hypothetical protein